jgi:tRNA G10  N-methylase Trm11
MQSLLILGRQPALGLAELESLFGPSTLTSVGNIAALLDAEPTEVDFDRLGGTIKLAKVLTTLDTTEWREIEKYLVKVSPKHAGMLPEGKLTIGISAYGLKVNPATVGATGLTLKKVIRKSGRSVRLVPNKELELNTAQVLHNNLTGNNGWELLLVRNGNQTILAQTVRVQDIESYTIRDRERPKRDARVGMLPPKLAQIIINLAVDGKNKVQGPLLDPFCGTGVLLQEALLMGIDVYGSDLEPRMIDYTDTNLQWLKEQYHVGSGGNLSMSYHLEVADATTLQLTSEHTVPIRFIAAETYLGKPFTEKPNPEVLARTVSDVNTIIKKFLRNLHDQLPEDARLCLAVPAWQVRPGQFKHLPLLTRDLDSPVDHLADMGYNRISFEHVRSEDLLYYRADQIVARELLVLIKK